MRTGGRKVRSSAFGSFRYSCGFAPYGFSDSLMSIHVGRGGLRGRSVPGGRGGRRMRRVRYIPMRPRCRPVRLGAFGPFPLAPSVRSVHFHAPCVSSGCVQFGCIPVRSSGRRIRIPIGPRGRRCRSDPFSQFSGGRSVQCTMWIIRVRSVHSSAHWWPSVRPMGCLWVV